MSSNSPIRNSHGTWSLVCGIGLSTITMASTGRSLSMCCSAIWIHLSTLCRKSSLECNVAASSKVLLISRNPTAQNFQKARFCAVFDVFLRFMKHFHVLCGFFERFSGAFPIPPPLSNRGQSFIITKWFGALLRMYDRREVRPAFLSGRSCCAAEHSQPIRAAAVVPCHVEKMGKGVFYYADK